MKGYIKEILILSVIAILLVVLFTMLQSRSDFFRSSAHGHLLPPVFLFLFAIINGLAHLGKRRDPDTQALFTLAVISFKFILPAVLAIIWFVVLNNTTNADVLLFFIVYLSFSLTTVLLIIRNLKTKLN
ncbi:MAG: hypothetical protein IH591_18335 [Bacteroidales bacterium]|nr:hypothetical protein [Bacteroidales bacterium]